MRTYGRIVPNILFPDVKKWVVVETDNTGSDDAVWLTTLIQTLKLNQGESPFFANYGIPAHNSVIQQLHPDFASFRTQAQYSKYFASLIISARPSVDAQGNPLANPNTPIYTVNVVTHSGAKPIIEVAT